MTNFLPSSSPTESSASSQPVPTSLETAFFALTPDRVLTAVEASGVRCTGRCVALNSFENRVYDVELDTDTDTDTDSRSVKPGSLSESASLRSIHRVVKFYRPGRWTQQQIFQEHAFLKDLVAEELSVIAPLSIGSHPSGSQTLFELPVTFAGEPSAVLYYALFPRMGGRAPEELSQGQWEQVGRLLARIHQVGAQRAAPDRLRLTPETYGLRSLQELIRLRVIPLEWERRYQAVVEKIVAHTSRWFEQTPMQRIHGDCHLGNLLWGSQGLFFLDFDDFVMGPPVQDLWLLTPGRPGGDPEALQHREWLLSGYEQMREFDRTSLRLIEPLRALRFVHYSAWLARRWADPAFPRAFPQFGSHRYWQDEVLDLERQWEWIQATSKDLL